MIGFIIEMLEERITSLYRMESEFKQSGNERGERNARNRRDELQSTVRFMLDVQRGEVKI